MSGVRLAPRFIPEVIRGCFSRFFALFLAAVRLVQHVFPTRARAQSWPLRSGAHALTPAACERADKGFRKGGDYRPTGAAAKRLRATEECARRPLQAFVCGVHCGGLIKAGARPHPRREAGARKLINARRTRPTPAVLDQPQHASRRVAGRRSTGTGALSRHVLVEARARLGCRAVSRHGAIRGPKSPFLRAPVLLTPAIHRPDRSSRGAPVRSRAPGGKRDGVREIGRSGAGSRTPTARAWDTFVIPPGRAGYNLRVIAPSRPPAARPPSPSTTTFTNRNFIATSSPPLPDVNTMCDSCAPKRAPPQFLDAAATRMVSLPHLPVARFPSPTSRTPSKPDGSSRLSPPVSHPGTPPPSVRLCKDASAAFPFDDEWGLRLGG